jgi:hypothetical protein
LLLDKDRENIEAKKAEEERKLEERYKKSLEVEE